MKNSARGTVDFNFDGTDLKLRPDIEAIEAIEDDLEPLICRTIAEKLHYGLPLKFKVFHTIVYHGIRAHYRDIEKLDKAPSRDEVKHTLYKEHRTASVVLASVIAQFLTFAITTPDQLESIQNKLEKKKKGTTKKRTKNPKKK